MKKYPIFITTLLTMVGISQFVLANESVGVYPIAEPGLNVTYRSDAETLPASIVRTIELTAGAVENYDGEPHQWLVLRVEKENHQSFSVWLCVGCLELKISIFYG